MHTKQITLNLIIRIHTLDIGIHWRRAHVVVVVVVFMLCRAINKGVITLLLTRLISFAPRTKQVQ